MGLNVNTGELLAVKRIHFDNITRDELAAIEQEILLLQKLRHQHIVSYMAIDITDTNLNILMEFCPGGSVAHLLPPQNRDPGDSRVNSYSQKE